MRWESFKQFAIVTGDTAQQLTERLNAELYRLRRKDPVVTFEGLTARIEYTEDEKTIETIAEAYNEAGCRLTCSHCPMFEPKLNKDGTEKRSAKWGGCIIKDGGMTSRESRACDTLFKMMEDGRCRICLDE